MTPLSRHLLLSVLLAILLAPAAPGQEALDYRKIKRGRWKSQHVPPGFFVHRYKRYQFQSNWDEKVVSRLARHMNLMFKVYWKLSPPRKTPTDLLVIKLFRTRKQFLAYGGSPGAAAYYSGRDKEMVGYNTGKVGGISTIEGTTGGGLRGRLARANSMDVLGVFSHEGWHQYFHWACGSKIPFPSWLDEGIGDYFYTAYPGKDGKIVLGAPMDGRLRTIQRAIRRKRHVPLEKIVWFEQADYYRNPGQNYAQGWSMVHFFMEHPHYKKKRIVQRFLKVFIDQHSIKRTIPKIFPRKTKWDVMERDWEEWVLSMPLEVDPDDPLAERTEEANKEARKHFEALPPDVRKALMVCLRKRAERPGSPAPLPDWILASPPAGK